MLALQWDEAGNATLLAFLAAGGAAAWKVIPWVLRNAVRQVVEDAIRPIHDRIDSHMDEEEQSLVDLAQAHKSLVAHVADILTHVSGVEHRIEDVSDLKERDHRRLHERIDATERRIDDLEQ